VADWCSSVGWTVEEDAAVVPKNGDNDVKAGVVKESVELSRTSGVGREEKLVLTQTELTKLVAAAAY
jgi:translation initiation factor 3 subunit K